MPRKRTGTDKRRPDIGEATWSWLNDEPISADSEDADVLDFVLLGAGRHDQRHEVWVKMLGHQTLRELWGIHGDSILTEWVRQRPGTRPRAWWIFDQELTEPPADQAAYLVNAGLMLPAERRRLGGS